MKSLRTPDSRFESLAGYAFAPHYTEVPDGEGGILRIHHVDEGPRDAAPILLLHGQPTWSYLYRKMIPILVDAGHRVLAPDLVGFGRSDKPSERSDYTFAKHVRWFSDWIRANDLIDITLFCQDWGGLVERFSNKEGTPGFLYWQKFCAETPEFRASDVIFSLSGNEHRDEGRSAGYDAPFPGPEFLAGARQFPSLVPIFADDPEIPANIEAWKILERFDKPFMTAFSDSDPVTAGGEQVFQKRVPGCQDVRHTTIERAGHFLQEEQPEACAAAILDFITAGEESI